MKYALILNNAIVEYREYPEPLLPEQIKHIGGLPILRPVVLVPAVGYDPDIHTKSVNEQITDTQVTQTEVRSDRPLAEVKAWKIRRLQGEREQYIEGNYSWANAITRLARGIQSKTDPQYTVMRDALINLDGILQTALDAVTAATTVDEVKAVTANWPQ